MSKEEKQVLAIHCLMIGMMEFCEEKMVEKGAQMLANIKHSSEAAQAAWEAEVNKESTIHEMVALSLVKMARRYFAEYEQGKIPDITEFDAWKENNKLSEFTANNAVLVELLEDIGLLMSPKPLMKVG